VNKVAITLDDGREQDFAVLAMFGKISVPVTCYISAGNICTDSRRDHFFPGMTAEQVVDEYSEHLCEIGAHGYYHWSMSEVVTKQRFDIEVVLADRELSARFPDKYRSNYAFPFGTTSYGVFQQLQSSGIYKTIRFYQTDYPWLFDDSGGIFKVPVIVPRIVTRHFSDIREFVQEAKGKDIVFAGHAGDFLRDPAESIAAKIEEVRSVGYDFFSLGDLYNG
jgi:peptidoglycan/xylan/chitin deacetylase (PgdA/CDA1 family)